MESDTLTFDSRGLVTAVAQDAASGDVLMVAHMNQEALERTLATGEAWYWSRSRNRLWRKGEESGHTQRVSGVKVDCDGDAVVLEVDQTGAACHTGRRSCFYRSVVQEGGHAAIGGEAPPSRPRASGAAAGAGVLSEVAAVLADRRNRPRKDSYSTQLFSEGLARLNEKVMEEAAEVTRAARRETRGRLVEEVADLWFHTLALLAFQGVDAAEVLAELARRRR